MWQLGALKSFFQGGSVSSQNTVLDLPATRILYKRLEMQQGCVFFDAESNGTTYVALSAEMTKIRAIFHLCGWFETTLKSGKLPTEALASQIYVLASPNYPAYRKINFKYITVVYFLTTKTMVCFFGLSADINETELIYCP